MIIKTRLFKDWPEDIQLALKNLTLRQGRMRYEVRDKNRTWVAFENNKPIGWCSVPNGLYMTYVKPAFRKRGIGKTLVTEAKRYRKRKGYSLPHTLAGTKLYNSTNIIIRKY